ncbi:hypothetical protein C8R45DRAFT_289959, partial [Mycena sanguinolenta]
LLAVLFSAYFVLFLHHHSPIQSWTTRLLPEFSSPKNLHRSNTQAASSSNPSNLRYLAACSRVKSRIALTGVLESHLIFERSRQET